MREDTCPVDIWGKSIPGGGNSTCKGPELNGVWNNEAGVAGADGAEGRVGSGEGREVPGQVVQGLVGHVEDLGLLPTVRRQPRRGQSRGGKRSDSGARGNLWMLQGG